MIYIGIDISKDSFVAAYPTKSGYTSTMTPRVCASLLNPFPMRAIV